MSYIRCYDPNSGKDANAKGFVVYSDFLVKGIAKLFEQLFQDTNVQKIVDPERVKVALHDLRTKRKNLVRVKARNKLGKHEGLMIDRGTQDFIPTDEFEASMHPMGVLMEAARKAAYGMTTPAPEGSVDGRTWYMPRRFVIECPEEKIIIDQEEMEDDIRRIITTSRRPRSLSSIMSAVIEARTQSKPEVLALRELEVKIRNEVQIEANEKRGAGKIIRCIIEIATSKHANKEDAPSKKIRDTEIAVAQSISEAIFNRVSMRMEALYWANTTPIAYVFSGTEG